MVSKVKAALVVLGAALAFSALCAGSVSAEWLVGGTVLSGSAALLSQSLVDASTVLLVPALGLAITCSGRFFDAVDLLVLSPDRVYSSFLSFLGCNTTEPATGCALESEEEAILTASILARAFLGPGEEDRLLFVPETKGVFANIKFSEKDTCAFGGVSALRGSFIVGLPSGRLNLLKQRLVDLGSVENKSLEFFGGSQAFLKGGSTLMVLTSDSTWSFM
jgi:hypothetical protein